MSNFDNESLAVCSIGRRSVRMSDMGAIARKVQPDYPEASSGRPGNFILK
jgi:hypothetical protein